MQGRVEAELTPQSFNLTKSQDFALGLELCDVICQVVPWWRLYEGEGHHRVAGFPTILWARGRRGSDRDLFSYTAGP